MLDKIVDVSSTLAGGGRPVERPRCPVHCVVAESAIATAQGGFDRVKKIVGIRQDIAVKRLIERRPARLDR